tara:strand:+ start:2138 stop:2851 length:714 start_codon:yes stop_codon:yes gene_type:complete
MAYFKNFQNIDYTFGNEITTTTMPNLLIYVDVIDEIKDQVAFYQTYHINDERPDQLSFKLYDNPAHYFTFYLLNDSIRRQGWPLSKKQIEAKSKALFHNTVITTRDVGSEHFTKGDVVTGAISTATGTILYRNLDLGQLVISGTHSFSAGEVLHDQVGNTITIHSVSPEYNAAKEYVDAEGFHADIDSTVGPGALLTEVTFKDFYEAENDKLNMIRVIKPEAINFVIGAFNKAVRNT